jgi:hypothetical protein
MPLPPWILFGGVVTLTGFGACVEPVAGPRRTVPIYEMASGRLIQLNADQNGDGRLDQWTYLDGNRPLRGEGDGDGDGRIDRWEYFDGNAQLTRVGSSSRNDGIEDTWTYVAPAAGERRVELSLTRDRHVTRREFYREATLERVEEDTNGDGRLDKWERYANGVLREAAFDTSLTASRADKRLLFDGQGRFEAIEDDSDRDGSFVRLTGEAAIAAKAGVKK